MAESLGFEIPLDDSYEQAIEKVTAELKKEGFGILTKIDVQATVKDKLGKDFRPYAILGACNPPLAHRALTHNAQVGMMLPCNVTVEATDSGGSIVRIGDPDVLLQVGNMDSDATLREIADEARACLKRAADSLAGS